MGRHPNDVFASGECIIKTDCAYTHVEPTENKEQQKLEEKVKQLENVAHALTRKVLCLETEIVNVKKNKTTSYVLEGICVS